MKLTCSSPGQPPRSDDGLMRPRMLTALLTCALLGAQVSLAATQGPAAPGTMTAAGPAAGTQIVNQASLVGLDSGGASYTSASNPVTMSVAHVPAVQVSPASQQVSAYPADEAALLYTVANPSNGTDTFTVGFAGPADPAALLTIDADDNGFDPADPQLALGDAYSLTLNPGESRPARLTLTTPFAAAGTLYSYQLHATSGADPATSASGTGAVRVDAVYAAQLLSAPDVSTPSPGVVVSARPLINVGNAPIDSAVDLAFSAGPYSAPATALTTGSWRLGGAWFATPQEAWNDWLSRVPAGLEMGQQLSLELRTALEPGLADRSVLTQGLDAALSLGSAPGRNDTPGPLSSGARITVATPALQVGKVQQGCLQSAGSWICGSVTADPINLRPCDVNVYTLRAENVGSGDLYAAVLRDALSSDLWIKRAEVTSGAAVLLRVDGGAWSPGPLTSVTGTVEAAPDSNGDGQITAADRLAAGLSFTLRLETQVIGSGCTLNSPAPLVETVVN